MKRKLLFILVSLFAITGFAQDVIVKLNGESVIAHVLGKKDDKVIYKLYYEDADDTAPDIKDKLYRMSYDKVKTIVYAHELDNTVPFDTIVKQDGERIPVHVIDGSFGRVLVKGEDGKFARISQKQIQTVIYSDGRTASPGSGGIATMSRGDSPAQASAAAAPHASLHVPAPMTSVARPGADSPTTYADGYAGVVRHIDIGQLEMRAQRCRSWSRYCYTFGGIIMGVGALTWLSGEINDRDSQRLSGAYCVVTGIPVFCLGTCLKNNYRRTQKYIDEVNSVPMVGYEISTGHMAVSPSLNLMSDNSSHTRSLGVGVNIKF